MTEFGQRIDQAQKEKNISNSDLAKRLNVTAPQVFSLKNKTKTPRSGTLTKIAKALGKSEEFFIARKVEKPKTILRRSKDRPQERLPVIESQNELDIDSQVHPIDEFEQQFIHEEPSPVTSRGAAPEASGPASLPLPPDDHPGVQAVPSKQGLRAYVVFEYQGKVISRKPLKRLPMDFEL